MKLRDSMFSFMESVLWSKILKSAYDLERLMKTQV